MASIIPNNNNGNTKEVIIKMPKKQQEKQHEQDFAKGLTVKVQETKFGDIIKVGINVEAVMENPINEQGFINVEIKKAKSGKLYAVLARQLEQ